MDTDNAPIAEQQPGERPIRYVLFVCNHNAGRSQMAQAFFERYGPEDVRAEFAGTEPAPEILPTVVEEIRACADAVLAGFDGARVRSHILTLAHRQTRDCLRKDTCDLLAAQEGA